MNKFIKVRNNIYKVNSKDSIYFYVFELDIRREYILDKNKYLKQFDEATIGCEKYSIGEHPIYHYKIYNNEKKNNNIIEIRCDEVDEMFYSLSYLVLINDKLYEDRNIHFDVLMNFKENIEKKYEILTSLILYNNKNYMKYENEARIKDIQEFLSIDYLYDKYIKNDETMMKLYDNIKKLKVKVKSVKNIECPCCYDNKHVKIGRYQCNHAICDTCYSNWKNKTCMMCRSYKNNVSDVNEYKEWCNLIHC
jgi:hypothetical protein